MVVLKKKRGRPPKPKIDKRILEARREADESMLEKEIRALVEQVLHKYSLPDTIFQVRIGLKNTPCVLFTNGERPCPQALGEIMALKTNPLVIC